MLQRNIYNQIENRFTNSTFKFQENIEKCPPKPNEFLVDLSNNEYKNINGVNIYGCNLNCKRIYSNSARLLLYGCNFNSFGSSIYGGAISFSLSTTKFGCDNIIDNCNFFNCSAMYGGAIYFFTRSIFIRLNITNTQFVNNRASQFANDIYFYGFKGRVENNYFFTNTTLDQKSIIRVEIQAYDSIDSVISFQKNIFEIQTKEVLNILDFALVHPGFILFTYNIINITDLNDKFKIISKDNEYIALEYFMFTNNVLNSPNNEKIFENTNNVKLNFTEVFEQNNSTKIPTISNGQLPDVILNDINCNIEKRCNYSINEHRTAYVLILVTQFNRFIQQKQNGGAVHILNCDVFCENSDFNECVSINGGGGAIYIKNGIEIDNKVVLNNIHMNKCKAVYGGALYIYSGYESSDVLIKSCSFTYNSILLNSTSNMIGGSALFLTIKNGNIDNCIFLSGKVKSQLIKVTNKFDNEKTKLNVLDHNNDDLIVFKSCKFKNDRNLILYEDDEKKFANEKNRIQFKSCDFGNKLNNAYGFQLYFSTKILVIWIICIAFIIINIINISKIIF